MVMGKSESKSVVGAARAVKSIQNPKEMSSGKMGN